MKGSFVLKTADFLDKWIPEDSLDFFSLHWNPNCLICFTVKHYFSDKKYIYSQVMLIGTTKTNIYIRIGYTSYEKGGEK